MFISPALAHATSGKVHSGGGTALLIILGTVIGLGFLYVMLKRWRRRKLQREGSVE